MGFIFYFFHFQFMYKEGSAFDDLCTRDEKRESIDLRRVDLHRFGVFRLTIIHTFNSVVDPASHLTFLVPLCFQLLLPLLLSISTSLSVCIYVSVDPLADDSFNYPTTLPLNSQAAFIHAFR